MDAVFLSFFKKTYSQFVQMQFTSVENQQGVWCNTGTSCISFLS